MYELIMSKSLLVDSGDIDIYQSEIGSHYWY